MISSARKKKKGYQLCFEEGLQVSWYSREAKLRMSVTAHKIFFQYLRRLYFFFSVSFATLSFIRDELAAIIYSKFSLLLFSSRSIVLLVILTILEYTLLYLYSNDHSLLLLLFFFQSLYKKKNRANYI